ncbi:MAG: AAA family ATPase [Limisphaerales bacterium]
MLTTLAVENYRSLRSLVVPLGRLNVIKGVNGSGKSNLYKSLRLLADTASGGIVSSLAREGGLPSTFWAGPEKITRDMRSGRAPIQGTMRKDPVRLKLGFSSDDFGYCITMGLPPPSNETAFGLDPEIKRECIWSGAVFKPERVLVDRSGPLVKIRTEEGWRANEGLNLFESIFLQCADPNTAPEVLMLRETIRGWRFYDQLRTDPDAPSRSPQLGTRTMVLGHDGRDLAAALQTILEIGDADEVAEAINGAFPGAELRIDQPGGGRFGVELHQPGLLRPLTGAELSDGTLRYLFWIAALLTPRPPEMMVLNEPETSLHPDLLPALAQLIINASGKMQVWVVTHSTALAEALTRHGAGNLIELEKHLGQTQVKGQTSLDRPYWKWVE